MKSIEMIWRKKGPVKCQVPRSHKKIEGKFFFGIGPFLSPPLYGLFFLYAKGFCYILQWGTLSLFMPASLCGLDSELDVSQSGPKEVEKEKPRYGVDHC
jgi:hypothetical protein